MGYGKIVNHRVTWKRAILFADALMQYITKAEGVSWKSRTSAEYYSQYFENPFRARVGEVVLQRYHELETFANVFFKDPVTLNEDSMNFGCSPNFDNLKLSALHQLSANFLSQSFAPDAFIEFLATAAALALWYHANGYKLMIDHTVIYIATAINTSYKKGIFSDSRNYDILENFASNVYFMNQIFMYQFIISMGNF